MPSPYGQTSLLSGMTPVVLLTTISLVRIKKTNPSLWAYKLISFVVNYRFRYANRSFLTYLFHLYLGSYCTMDHLSFSVYLKFFIGLTAIINPLGLLPVFVSLTSQQTPQERLRTNTTANFAVMVILWVSMFFGQVILDLFGISIASFRIAGGSLIVLIAWSMLQGKLGEVRHNKEEKGDTLAKESIAVVPLALPLMAGPGAISSTIVYSSQFNSAQQLMGMSLVVVLFCFASWLIFRAAPLLFRLMGRTGINVVTRIMGLIMMSLGIEIMVAGIKHMFPVLA